ncbi:SnoaL-like domain-containing protein [Sphingomonas antarctica]|uniref:nuclear transport factor 2 family protein n=1 Tax=Sphingomonas antarctica TaxID=2040274 RepID=UPI0039EAB0E7
MYHAIVRRRVAGLFADLSAGNYETALAGMAPRFEHIFSGTHALGGTRHSTAAMRAWFERLYRLSPDLNFTIKHIAVSGWPADTTVTIEWRDTATLADGSPYVNDGVHVVRMKWGKVVSLHAYLDTEIYAEACRRLAANGFPEAVAPPIED